MPYQGAIDVKREVVAYINADVGLMATVLCGNSNPSDPSYTVESVDQHLVIAHHNPIHQVSSVLLSNSAQNGQVMVLYEQYYPFSATFELWGQFLAVNVLTNLPLVMR